MNSCLKLTTRIVPTPIQVTYGGLLTDFDNASNCWVIDGAFKASCAVSLLVQPCRGDRVCFVEMEEEYYITQLLSRVSNIVTLTITLDKKVHWQAPEIKLTTFESLELISLNNISLIGKNYAMSVTNTLIQQAENLLQQVGQYSLTAKGLLRMKGKHQVITAVKDVRIDGERINMG